MRRWRCCDDAANAVARADTGHGPRGAAGILDEHAVAVAVHAPALSPAIDDKAVAAATASTRETSPDGVVKASFPRKGVDVTVDGWKTSVHGPDVVGGVLASARRVGGDGDGDLVLFEER